MTLYVEIGERTHDFEPRSILCQSTISHIKKAKNSRDDQKGMFNPGPDFRFRSVFRTIKCAQTATSRAPLIGHIPGFGSRLPDCVFLILVSAIAPDLCFVAVKKLRNDPAIMDIG
jgi:hypothetical protein